jgi:hypothetical protein
VVDFGQVGPADWDRVYVFSPYTPTSHIDAALGFHWPAARWSAVTNYSEGCNLVVFVRDKEVVGWYDHSRLGVDLAGVAGKTGYAREEAKFGVVRDGGDQRLVLTRR